MAAGMRTLDSTKLIDVSENTDSPAIAVYQSPDLEDTHQLRDVNGEERIVESLELQHRVAELHPHPVSISVIDEDLYAVTPPKDQPGKGDKDLTSQNRVNGSQTVRHYGVREEAKSVAIAATTPPPSCASAASVLANRHQPKISGDDCGSERSQRRAEARTITSGIVTKQPGISKSRLPMKSPLTSTALVKRAPEAKATMQKKNLPKQSKIIRPPAQKVSRLSRVVKGKMASPLPLVVSAANAPARSAAEKLRSKHSHGKLPAAVRTTPLLASNGVGDAHPDGQLNLDPRLQSKTITATAAREHKPASKQDFMIQDVYEFEISPPRKSLANIEVESQKAHPKHESRQVRVINPSSANEVKPPELEAKDHSVSLEVSKDISKDMSTRTPPPNALSGEAGKLGEDTAATIEHDMELDHGGMVAPNATSSTPVPANQKRKRSASSRPDGLRPRASANTTRETPRTMLNTSMIARSREGASQRHAIVLSDRESSSDDNIEHLPPSGKSHPSTVTLRKDLLATPNQLGSGARSHASSSVATRKVNIIKFDKSGPQNQGLTLSTKKVNPNDKHTRSAENNAGIMMTTHSNDFLGKRHYVDAHTDAIDLHARQIVVLQAQSNVAGSFEDALKGLLGSKHAKTSSTSRLPDQSSRTVTRVKHKKYGTSAPDGTSLAVLNDDIAINDDSYNASRLTIDTDIGSRTSVTSERFGRTASQLAMPPPPKKQMTSFGGTGRSVAQSPTRDAASTADNRSNAIKTPRHGDMIPSSAEIKLLNSMTEIPSTSANILFQPMSKLAEAKSRRIASGCWEAPIKTTTLTRKKSNRTVDFGGSPIPHDMDVAEKDTVLETYVQYASPMMKKLASERSRASSLLRQDRSQKSKTPASASDIRHPERLNDNGKSTPAADQTVHEATPKSKQDRSEQPRQSGLNTSEWITHSIATGNVNNGEDDSRKRFAHHKTNVLSCSTAEALSTQICELRDHLEPSSAHVADSARIQPSTVESHIQEARDTLACGLAVATKLSQPTASDAQMHTWRAALAPEHLNLYDELVNVAHRLTQHLVDEETASRQALDDYRRRSLCYIERLEVQRREMYTQLERDIERKRDLTRNELMMQQRWLQDFERRTEEKKQQRLQDAMEREKMYRRVEGLIAG